MSAHALSPRSADFLPPTLQPHAITQAAPGTDRRLSFLVACLVYSSAAAFLVFTAKNPEWIKVKQIKTQSLLLIDPAEIQPVPPMPLVVDLGQHFAPPGSKTSILDPVEHIQTDVIPDTPAELPRMDLLGFVGKPELSDHPNPLGMNPNVNPPQRVDPRGTLGTPVVMELQPSAVKVLHQIQPTYPPLARLARVQGSVVLQMIIDSKGVPTDVRVLSSPHPSLAGESLRVARLWRFEAARMEGHPVAAKFNLTLNFVLR